MRHVPFPVWRLGLAYALVMSGGAMMVLVAGIIGLGFAPDPGLATLPVALTVVGVAASTLPTGRLMQRFGRRPVFLANGAFAVLSALGAAAALATDSFPAFCACAFGLGWAAAAGHQYRFAAFELVPPELAPAATSVLLLGGIASAFVGPELALAGRDLLATPFAGSYVLLACACAAGTAMMLSYREPPHDSASHGGGGRPLRVILGQGVVLLAIGSAVASYGVMSFIMTATPISMHEHAGHSLAATKWVIQGHIAAMYLPSMVFALLLARLGMARVLWAGVACFAVTLAVAAADQDLAHYALALALLGVGWNLLFLAGTNLLPRGYAPNERYRVQATNDFIVFTVQAVVALGSGWFLVLAGWHGLLAVAALMLGAYVLLLWRQRAALGG